MKQTIVLCLIFFCCYSVCTAQTIHNDKSAKQLILANKKIRLLLDYDRKANISSMEVNGKKVIDGSAGVYSAIRTKEGNYTTLKLSSDPVVNVTGNLVSITGIKYGSTNFTIAETWKFAVTDSAIQFDIDRTVSAPVKAEKIAFPVFTFRDTAVWEGAYQDYGGLAWFYLFNKRLDTYGVHSHSSRFWNSRTGIGLNVAVAAPRNAVVMDYSRTAEDRIAYSIGVSPTELQLRFDSGTQRRRYTRDTTDVWAPFTLAAGMTSQHITLSGFDFDAAYGRGKLVGINGTEVSGVLNTIARIGVIDKQHFGGNSWHTPYGPICLHEQYIAQLGLAINDSSYLRGYRECLDFYRDHAIKPDGRVWPRWAYTDEDAMPGQATTDGFYEAQWGYLLDANPDLVSNVAELYDMTGDLPWVATHRLSCEKALDWLLKRDGNGNGLVEMMTDSYKQKRGSDWLDIIWAAYENAFVNAKLYHALVLWADVETQLGHPEKGGYYSGCAAKLKSSFNKSVKDGGFWDEANNCYIHWRDKDGSLHGRNMVTSVNFMAIGYGICDDEKRRNTILDAIETQMEKEKLFFWPACMSTYGPGEGNDWQFPFPRYENGDLFLSWGAMGVKAYAAYKPELALKYVKNVLAQYEKDGLAFQRYGRAKQDGLGDDILSGNSLSVVGLYQAIYGINPLHDRFFLDPHITPELEGTRLRYNFRGQKLEIGLDKDRYSVSNGRFSLAAAKAFGFFSKDNRLSFFADSHGKSGVSVAVPAGAKLDMEVRVAESMCRLSGLKPNTQYTVMEGSSLIRTLKSDKLGEATFEFGTDLSRLHRLEIK